MSEIVDATGGSTRFYPTHLFTVNCRWRSNHILSILNKEISIIAKVSPIHFYQLFGCKLWVQQSKRGHPDLALPNHLL